MQYRLTATEQTPTSRHDVVLITLLLIVTAVVLGKDITAGGFRHGDSAIHAMDGVLIHDWVMHGGSALLQPMKFATEQYAHYPALGIGRHYPPGFAVVEAPFFAVFGISPVSARLCVVFFGLLATVAIYVYIRSLNRGRAAAFLGSIALITMPATTRWGRQVMLEMPTVAVLLWAAVAFSHYLRKPTWGRLFLVLAVSAAAILFKQPAVFLLGALAGTLLVGVLRRKIPPGHGVLAGLVATAAGVVVVLSLDGHGAKLWRGDATFDGRSSWAALTFYLRAVPGQVGLVVLAAAFLGAAAMPFCEGHAALRPRRRWRGRFAALGLHGVFLGAWFSAYYVLLILADYKNARFLFLGLFPLAVLAGLGAGHLLALLRSLRVRVALASAVSIAGCVNAFGAPVEHRPDYGTVVEGQRDQILGRAVLFSGSRDGDFVFAVRQHLPWRTAVVIRGSKLLYTCNGRPDLDFVSNIASAEELDELMRRFAFQYVFLERENKLGLREDRLLREYLRTTGNHRLRASYRFRMEKAPTYRDRTVEVYEAVQPQPRHVKHFDILIPRAHRTVRVNLSEWS